MRDASTIIVEFGVGRMERAAIGKVSGESLDGCVATEFSSLVLGAAAACAARSARAVVGNMSA